MKKKKKKKRESEKRKEKQEEDFVGYFVIKSSCFKRTEEKRRKINWENEELMFQPCA